MRCRICGKNYNHLGSHLWHGHRTLAKEYKMEFGLPLNYALISREIWRKKSEEWHRNKKKYLPALLKYGKENQFPKGIHQFRGYIAPVSKRRALSNLKKINRNSKQLKICPVCKMKANHLDSHLYNAHRLIRAKWQWHLA